ncbi:tetraspanin-15 [Coffea eugenioides]|uniref:tetraspanin-15 n=1 Tax=Coffea eugenioides TaxID=49369 RepID=UPI000F61539D|nr:tetraspanin-15 [Coffea eugenioides]
MAQNSAPPEEVVVPVPEEKNEAKEKEVAVTIPEAKNEAEEKEVAVLISEAKNEAKEKEAKEIPDDTTTTAAAATTNTSVAAKTDKMKIIVLSLTVLSFLLSFPILFSIAWLLYLRQYDCENLLDLPKLQLVIVIGLAIVFFVSNFVVKFGSRFPMLGLLLVVVPLILMLIVGLGLEGAFDMEARTIPGTPRWLEFRVDNDYNWKDVKSCLYATTTCRELALRSYTTKSFDFTASKLSSIESGCCLPPTSCGMEYVNATFWRKEDSTLDSSNPLERDCDLWKNDETILCYNCQACKDGFLKPLLGKWQNIGTFLIVMAALLSASHLLLFISTMLEQLRGYHKSKLIALSF